MPKPPSPCLDVCKFKLDGRCIACAMTKTQKKSFKRLETGRERCAFVVTLHAEQRSLAERHPGRFRGWERAYARKCEKKGVENPIG